jgi:hypothetical protein
MKPIPVPTRISCPMGGYCPHCKLYYNAQECIKLDADKGANMEPFHVTCVRCKQDFVMCVMTGAQVLSATSLADYCRPIWDGEVRTIQDMKPGEWHNWRPE